MTSESMATSPYTAGARILDVAQRHPDRIALVIDSESWSFAELLAAARQIASAFPSVDNQVHPPVPEDSVCVLA